MSSGILIIRLQAGRDCGSGVKCKAWKSLFLEKLHKFSQRYAQGPIDIFDSKGVTHRLKYGEPDAWDLADKADRFRYLGTIYSRADFAALIEEAMMPSNPQQIG